MIDSVVLPNSIKRHVHAAAGKVVVASLVLYALFAPHSIAVTQGSALLGILAWAVQLLIDRDFKRLKTPVDIALLGFFAWCVLSSFLSYYPLISIKGLRSPAFFVAFYFVSSRISSIRLARGLLIAMIASCLLNVAYSGAQLAQGRGIRINSIQEGSPLVREGIVVGDVLLTADGKPLNSTSDLINIASLDRGRMQVTYQRGEMLAEASVSRRAIRRAAERGFDSLGITTSPGRSFRVSGFYSHYETYAEVLQLLAAVAAGLLIGAAARRSGLTVFLGTSLVLILAALVLTSTRAALAGIALSIVVMSLLSFHRRTLAIAAVGILILVPVSLIALQQIRGIRVLDPSEGSTAYRLEVWQEALQLIRTHPLVGIGKGSEGKLKDELGLFDDGRLPASHFHSTPIQIAAWWGLPALGLYIATMTIMFREAWLLYWRSRTRRDSRTRGIALGCLGALIAFNFSSLVHFNFGDGEVAMTMWLLMGILFAARRIFESQEEPSDGLRLIEGAADGSSSSPSRVTEEPTYRAAGVK